MRKITFTIIILLTTIFINSDAKNIDSLQRELDTASTNVLKAKLYTSIAAELIQFNTAKTKEISYEDADKSIEYVLKAIHFNSGMNDTLAIRNNFDCLASAYIIQKKYTQAKWFLLQSNAISRDRKDVPSMLNSLMQLASVKIAINDYKMAEKDFQEAIVLSKYQNDVNHQIAIEKCLATLYDNTNRARLAAATEKHCDYLAANIAQITIRQAKENKVRAIEEAKSAKLQAKAYAAKVALWMKVNQPKIELQAKIEKVKERGYLAMIKAQSQWPLFTIANNPVVLKVQNTHIEEAKERQYLAMLKAQSPWPLFAIVNKPAVLKVQYIHIEEAKERKYLAMLKAQSQWPLFAVVNKPVVLKVQNTHVKQAKSGSENTALAIAGQDN